MPGDDGKEAKFVLTRSGLTWKLTNILIPDMEAAGGKAVPTTEARSDKPQTTASEQDQPKNCLTIQSYDSSVLSANDVFTELAWKVDVANTCSRAFEVRVRFAIFDKDDFELDSDSENIYVPEQGLGKARGKMSVNPPAKARRMAKQGARISPQ